jgi:predicted Zn-dependent protease
MVAEMRSRRWNAGLDDADRRAATATRLRLSLAAAAAVLAAACATNPVTGQKQFVLMSEAEELQIGQQLDGEVRNEMGVYNDPELQRYVEDIGLRLARGSHRPNLPWSFAIVDSPAVNAFALPGGYIYLTRGILAYLNDEAELAGVLGHEIGHVTARHAVEQYTRAGGTQLGLLVGSIFLPGMRPYGDLVGTGFGILFLKYGREDELQADRLGVEYAARGGWDPGGVADMLRTLSRLDETSSDRRGTPNWLSTHPDPASRVAQIEPVIAGVERGAETPGRTARDEYLRRIDGLLYGDNPREGIVRGPEFLHPDLRFALRFPEGWDVRNSSTQVVANLPGTRSYMVLQLLERPRGGSLEAVAIGSMRDAGFRAADGGARDINGLEGWVGTFTGRMRELGDVVARAAFVRHDRRIYRLVGFAPRAEFDRIAGEVGESLLSFRPLDRREADAIQPNRVALYTVRGGDTWQRIAQGPGRGLVRPSTLAILNGFDPAEQPQPGDRIKIVVPGES